MPGKTASEPPSVSLSFANNFWGKDDAGVSPMLERMHNAKITSDELKAFYTARAAIEDEYARKLLNLARKPLGSSEAGTLRMSLDIVRGEVESMGKAHQNIAGQMKSELDEPLAAFSGGLKERRKIVQGGIEKLLKVKMQQTMTVNKTRDRFEQDCLKVKGFLAQAHMVMGQEERKNKAKLEKTQIQLSSTSSEYETAVKVLEETTGRWNRDWKAACDKFQDLEEERIDFMKSSLWTFANIASTVCVSDDASCEKIRLSLEDCDVEKDVCSFIRESGTGQEIPDPPKFINFCRGDVNDTASEASDDGNYSVAQFQRTINPAFRNPSPQPSTYESHHEAQSSTRGDQFHTDSDTTPKPKTVNTPHTRQKQPESRSVGGDAPQIDPSQLGEIPKISYNEHPMDGMTQFCRPAAPIVSTSPERNQFSTNMQDANRPSSRDSQSDYSNPASFSSAEPFSSNPSPTKQMMVEPIEEKQIAKKKNGIFQGHSPFRRRSKQEKDAPSVIRPLSQNTWGPSSGGTGNMDSNSHEKTTFGNYGIARGERSVSPEPVDPRANFQLNVGNNVFDVASPDTRIKPTKGIVQELDPIAQALADLKKASSVRVSADRYHGIATPAPPTNNINSRQTPTGGIATPIANSALSGAQRGTPPPSYEQEPVGHLGAPQPAFTSRQMQQTTQRYIDQKQNMFNSTSRPSTRGSNGQDMVRASSPAPLRTSSPVPPRAASPRPSLAETQQNFRAPSPNPYRVPISAERPRAQSSSPVKGTIGNYSRVASPAIPRAVSPAPQFRQPERPGSSRGSDMILQLAPVQDSHEGYGAQGSHGGVASSRPVSGYYGYGSGDSEFGSSQMVHANPRVRSKSVAEARQYTKDGRPILRYCM